MPPSNSRPKDLVRVFLRILVWMVAAVGVLLFTAPWFLGARPSWPKISDSDKLRHEARLLIEHGKNGELKQEDWPEAIAALKPRMVSVGPDKVDVMISGGGISALPWGFYIWPEGIDRPDGGIEKYDAAKAK